MIPFSDPFASYQAHKQEVDGAIQRVLDSGWYVLGKEVNAFEDEFASFHGENLYAVGVANGTDAIALCLLPRWHAGLEATSHNAARVAQLSLCSPRGFVASVPGVPFSRLEPRNAERRRHCVLRVRVPTPWRQHGSIQD